MKQGSSKTIADFKTEPKSRGVNPAAVSELGIHPVRTQSIKMFEGRGLEAPKPFTTIHHGGSQRRHK